MVRAFRAIDSDSRSVKGERNKCVFAIGLSEAALGVPVGRGGEGKSGDLNRASGMNNVHTG